MKLHRRLTAVEGVGKMIGLKKNKNQRMNSRYGLAFQRPAFGQGHLQMLNQTPKFFPNGLSGLKAPWEC